MKESSLDSGRVLFDCRRVGKSGGRIFLVNYLHPEQGVASSDGQVVAGECRVIGLSRESVSCSRMGMTL